MVNKYNEVIGSISYVVNRANPQNVTLITGVTGTTGSGILDILLKDPEVKSGRRFIVGIDNLFRGPLENISHLSGQDFKHFIMCVADYRDLIGMYEDYSSEESCWLDRVDQIYHMAAIVQTPHFYNSPDMTYEVNCKGTIDLFNLFMRRPLVNGHKRKFIEGSSSEIYGHIFDEDLPAKETTRSVFDSVEDSTRWSYAEGKLLVEHYLDKFKDEVDVCHLRFANTYGERDLDPCHIIPYMINGIIKGETLHFNPRWSEFKRTFLNNKDSAKACVKVMRKGQSGFAYNVGSDYLISIKDLYELIVDILEEEYEIVNRSNLIFDVIRPGDPLVRVLDTSRLKEHTGFSPQVFLRDGIREMIDKFNEENKEVK